MSSSTSISASISTDSPLLQLPLEIRLLIYDFSHKIYIASLFGPNGHRCHKCQHNLNNLVSFQNLKITSNNHQLPHHRVRNTKIGFFALRQTNRQVAAETLRVIQFPHIRLHITDDLTFTLCSAERTLEFMGQWLLRENTEEVLIDLRLGSGIADSQLEMTTKRVMGKSVVLMRYLYLFLRNLIRRHNFRLMAALLMSFPRLKKLRFSSCAGDDFFSLWLDPVDDMRALSSLVRRDVEVEFSLPDGSAPIFERRVSGSWRCLRKGLVGDQLRWKDVERPRGYYEGENTTAVIYILQ